MIGEVKFGKNEKKSILKAIDLRNKITHADFELTATYAEAKFFEVFSFVIHFQALHLNFKIENIIPPNQWDKLLAIKRSREELLKKAQQRILEEEIEECFILECSNCLEETFVAQDEIDTCYLCRHTEPVIECPHCNELCLASYIESFEDDIDAQCEEGQNIIYNSYGYSEFIACPDCLPDIRDDIQNQRDEEYYHHIEMEEFYRNSK